MGSSSILLLDGRPAAADALPRSGCFTTARLLSGKLIFWPAHWARLERDARRLGLAPPDRAALEADLAQVRAAMSDARVRIRWGTVGDGISRSVEAEPYLPPSRAWTLEPLHWPSAATSGGVKSLDREGYESARAHATCRADDALLVDGSGRFLECSVANLWLRQGALLRTPPPGEPILAGIARDRLLALVERSDRNAQRTSPKRVPKKRFP